MTSGGAPVGQNEKDYAEHREAVVGRIAALLARGVGNLMDLLPECDGADPRLVAELLEEMSRNGVSDEVHTAAIFREADSTLPWKMPAADPELAQWWFTLSTIDWLAERINVFVHA